jgi:hypothetical protein
MFSSGIVPPAIVREYSRTDIELTSNEAYDLGRRCVILRELASGMTHQAELNGEAELVVVSALTERPIKVIAAHRIVADQAVFVSRQIEQDRPAIGPQQTATRHGLSFLTVRTTGALFFGAGPAAASAATQAGRMTVKAGTNQLASWYA